VSTGQFGNRSNYYRKGKPCAQVPYRRHIDWKDRQANIGEEGFDNDKSHGIIRLPDSGSCRNCGKPIINESDHKPANEEDQRMT